MADSNKIYSVFTVSVHLIGYYIYHTLGFHIIQLLNEPLCYVFALTKYKQINLETAFTQHRTFLQYTKVTLFKNIYKFFFLLIVETYFFRILQIWIKYIQQMINNE